MDKTRSSGFSRARRGRQILNAKITIPEISRSLVERTGLLEEIEKTDARITVFNAGAGYGKTILMAQLAKRHEVGCVWYQVDSSDNDPVYFMQGILYGILQFAQEDARASFYGSLQELRQTPEQMLPDIVELLSELLREPVYLMLDDVHEISNERVITVLCGLMDSLPANVRFCFTVKGSFPQFLASYMVRNRVFLIEADRLCFSEEETRRMIRQQTGYQPDEEAVKSVQAYVEGWPAGVMFACLSLKADHSLQEGSLMLNHTKIFDYIYYEIFRRLPYDIQQFLTNTSVLESVSAPLCNYVLDRQDSAGVLEYLAAENMFVYKLRGEKKWYRYHSIFRDFLRERIVPGQKKTVLSRAAQYFLRMGETDQAVVCAMEGGSFEIVAAAVEMQTESMLRQGRQSSLRQWIQYLEPYQGNLNAPCLYAIYRFFRDQNDLENALESLSQAIARAHGQEDWERLGRYALERTEYLEEQNQSQKAIELLIPVVQMMRGKPTADAPVIRRKMLEYRLQKGNWNCLTEFTERVAAGRRRIPLVMERNMVLWALELRDKQEGWGNTLEEARMYRRVSPVYAEYGFFCYARFLYQKGDPQCRRVLQEGTAMQGGSCYANWMSLVEMLWEYKKARKQSRKAELRENIQQVCSRLQQQKFETPDLSEEDEKLLSAVLLGEAEEGSGEREPLREEALLRVFCLGSFSVRAGEEPLRWRTKKTRELFACLFEAEGKGLDKNALIFRLWPEASEKNGSVLFNTTVSYLRRTLASADAAQVLQVKDRLYSLDMSRIWSDAGRLKELAEWIRKKEFAEIGNPQELVSLYGGEYMGSEDYRWLVGRREYVEQLFLQAARQLALHEMEEKHWGTAIVIFQKMLDVSVCSSSILRLLLTCRMKQGDVGGAYRQYEKVRDEWEQEWEQELPAEMTEFLEEGGDETW